MMLAAAQSATNHEYRRIPCKTPESAPSCKHVHGVLDVAEGTPAIRFVQIGSHHVYGIYSNRYGFMHDNETEDNEAPELHFALPKGATGIFWSVSGDFEVCSLEPHVNGHMQAACINKAAHLVARKD